MFFLSAIFQAGGLIVVVVEVTRKAFLASLVPVIVDTILNEHQVVADIVAFVSHGDFPRSRLGEKQRGKVLASWVTRKLRTLAQFSIRDMEGDHPFADVMHHRASRSSKPGSTMGNSMRMSTMHEDDAPAVPRSPAGVALEDRAEAPQGPPYQEMPRRGTLPELDTQTDHSVPVTPVPAATSAVPYIQEPQSATIMSADDDHFDSMGHEHSQASAADANRDFRFSFEMASAPLDSFSQDPAPPTHQHLPRGDSLPNQQTSMAGPAYPEKPRPGTQESGVIDDWPAEALMYQSALGDDGQAAAHRR